MDRKLISLDGYFQATLRLPFLMPPAVPSVIDTVYRDEEIPRNA